MSAHTTTQTQRDQFVTDMLQRMTTLAGTLSDWVTSEPRTLGQIEQQLVRTIKDLGVALLAGLCQLTVPTYPLPTVPCTCGAAAAYQRVRKATVKTVLDTITLARPYYLCSACHHGHAPLDQQLEFCAGSISAGLSELLALLGANEDSFAAAAAVLEKLTLVSVCPNSVREASEQLGQVLLSSQQHTLATAQATTTPAPLRQPSAPRMYVSMDGILVHIRDEGWKEAKLGAIYTTSSRVPRQRPEQLEVRAVAQSFVTEMADAATFGPRLWAEAAARGVLEAEEVVVIGDGAHWIWTLAQEYFPEAVQILDWYHATEYLWQAAHAIYGEGSDLAKRWATQQLDQLWEGKLAEVIGMLEAHLGAGKAIEEALNYYTNHQERMRYQEYRARGMQIGSGIIESGCKHVIGTRLKQAGMIWDRAGALAVAVVRAWLKSGRWEEAMRLRAPLRRRYQRQGVECASASAGGGAGTPMRCSPDPEAPATPAASVPAAPDTWFEHRAGGAIGAALVEQPEQVAPARPAADHPWRRAWSRRRQRQQVEAQRPEPAVARSA